MSIKYYDIMKNVKNIAEGDTIEVASDLYLMIKNCAKNGEEFNPDILIDSIIEKVGLGGTVMIRVWNWDFCHGVPFDRRNTPSQVGALGNVALRRKEFRRTKHPLYSFAVCGARRDELCGLDNKSAWGADSPFGYITRICGKQLMLGATMWNSLTYVHYVEEQIGVPYRYLKDFTGEYIDEDGSSSVRIYQMNVRDLSLDIKITSENFAPAFFEANALVTQDFDGVSVSVVDLAKAYPIIEDDIRNNASGTFCSYKPKLKT